MKVKTASFFLSLSACQARSAKREEGGYVFLVVFAVCGAILPFLPRKKPQRDPFSLDIRRETIGVEFMCAARFTRISKGSTKKIQAFTR